MSDLIKKLSETCELIGEKCDKLVDNQKSNNIDEIQFVNQYFDMLNKMPNSSDKERIITDLQQFKNEKMDIFQETIPEKSEVK